MKIVNMPRLIASCDECPYFGVVKYEFRNPVFVCIKSEKDSCIQVIDNPNTIHKSCKLEDAPGEKPETESVRDVLEQAKETVTEFFNVCDKVSEDIHANVENTHLAVDVPKANKEWSRAEIDAIRGAKSFEEARNMYFKAFPDSKRTLVAIKNKHQVINGKPYPRKAPAPERNLVESENPPVSIGTRVKVKKGILFGKTCKVQKSMFDEDKQAWTFRIETDGSGTVASAWVYSGDFEVLE